MIVFLSSDKLKKSLADVRRDRSNMEFFIMSYELETDYSYPKLYNLQTLVPPMHILDEYMEGNEGKAQKKYIKYIESNPEVYEEIINIGLSLSNGKAVFIVMSDIERGLKYYNDLGEYISKKYGIKTYDNKSFKKLISKGHIEEDLDTIFTEDGFSRFQKDLKNANLFSPSTSTKEKIYTEMSKKELKSFILKKCKMSEKKFDKKFGDDYKKKELVKYILKL